MGTKASVSIVAVDLFCGAGGLSFGMKRAGLDIAAGIDVDPVCRHPFESNVGANFHEMDVAEVTSEWLASLYPEGSFRVLAGCAPCQPFSSYSKRRSGQDDGWGLLSVFGSLVKDIRPEVVSMENVPGLTKSAKFPSFMNDLTDAGYKKSVHLVPCSDYGVPQRRRRLVVLGSLLGDIHMLPKSSESGNPPTVRGAIGHLPKIEAGSACDSDPLHRSSGLSDKNMKRIRQSIPGGTWKDWDVQLRANCHLKESGKPYSDVYGRMEWDKIGPTITTHFNAFGSGRFGHPDQDRAISLREGALLQTFPQSYSFAPEEADMPISSVARMIGNAVPVKLGEAIGLSIRSHLEEINGD